MILQTENLGFYFVKESGNAFPIRGSLENFNNSLFKDNNYEFLNLINYLKF